MFYSYLTKWQASCQISGLLNRCYTRRHEMKAALISLLHILCWCSVSASPKLAHFCLKEQKQKREYSMGLELRGRKLRRQWLWIRPGTWQYSVCQTFVSWLIKIQEARHVKLLNELCIYDACILLCLCFAALKAFHSHSLITNILPYTYCTIFCLNFISMSLGSHFPTGDLGLSSSALVLMDYMSLSDPWPQACSLKRVCRENKQKNDENCFTVHLKR